MDGDFWIREHPILKFDRGPKIKFNYQGKKINAYQGETIGAALYAAGVDIFSRSLKYHRPRGMFCVIGKCSSCLMRVDGVPNVKTCVTPVEDGMKVEAQTGYPTPEQDIYGVMDTLSPLFPIDFPYKLFHRPRFARNLFLRGVRSMTGLGAFPTRDPSKNIRASYEEKETEIAIIGAGPAGLSAAITAGKLAKDVTLIDENAQLGGQLVKQTHMFFGSKDQHAGTRGIDIADELGEEVRELDNVEALLDSTVIGIYDDNILGVVSEDNFTEICADKIIICTGARERYLAFENNDLPGVMGAGGIQTLMNVHGVKPGEKALVVGAGNVGLIVAFQLIQAGVTIEAIVEAAPEIGGYQVHASKLARRGIPILTSHTIKKARGSKRVEGAQIVELNENWNEIEGTEQNIDCDLICVAIGLEPAYQTLFMAGCDMKHVGGLGGPIPLRTENLEITKHGIYFAGDVGGIEEATTAMLEGKITAAHAAKSLGHDESESIEIIKRAKEDLNNLRSGPFCAPVELAPICTPLWEVEEKTKIKGEED